MSFLNILLQGDETLVRAPHAYLPLPVTAPADTAYAHWTSKLASQHALGVARELAGLPEPRLAELAAEFVRAPQRQRTDKLRMSFPLAAALLLAGAIALAFDASLRAAGSSGMSVLQGMAIGCFVGGAGAVIAGVLAAFAMKPLEVAHSKLGQCLGLLDEQHAWLYDASLVMRNPAADTYRQHTLQERGPLRGIDYVMMCEVARVSDALDMTHVARSVAERLNTVDAPKAGAGLREPRLTTVAASSAFIASAVRAGGKDPHVT